MRKTTLVAAICAVLLPTVNSNAGEREELLQIRATTLNLIEVLVKEGVLSQEGADKLLAQAKEKAAAEAQMVERTEAAKAKDSKVVRVPYIPQFVRDEIRDQVRNELREDVTQDVLAQAKNERWGVPGVLPDWTSRIKLKGDIRLRSQGEYFGADNGPAFDWQASNEQNANVLLNTTEDRQRLRARLRLGLDAKITESITAGVRLTTGDTDNPVSTNQNLGNYGNRYQLVVDQAFLRYDAINGNGNRWLLLSGGRIPNPWLSTDLVWDIDLGFEGVAATVSRHISSGEGLYAEDDSDRSVYLTLGAFPLSTERSVFGYDKAKWLYGAQLGIDWLFKNRNRLEMGLAYYDYRNIEGRPDPLATGRNDWTAPAFQQKGNSTFDIQGTGLPPYGLVSDFNIVNLTARYDIARFAPAHVILIADYARNIGFDRAEILARTGLDVEERTNAYQVGVTVGWPEITKRRDWQVFGFYKHLERDAVLDTFTDSDFHLGGTDAEGWILGGSYGLADNTWLTLRWMSADEINGRYDDGAPEAAPFAIDVLQVDLNAKF